MSIAEYYDRKRRDAERYQRQLDLIDAQIDDVMRSPACFYKPGTLERLKTHREQIVHRLEMARFVGD